MSFGGKSSSTPTSTTPKPPDPSVGQLTGDDANPQIKRVAAAQQQQTQSPALLTASSEDEEAKRRMQSSLMTG